MCSSTLSPEERVVRARAQCGTCAQFVETYCLEIASRILRNQYSGTSRTFGIVLDEYVQPRVSRQIIDPYGSYNPAYKLAGYLPDLVKHAWNDFCRDITEEGGMAVLIDDLRPSGPGSEASASLDVAQPSAPIRTIERPDERAGEAPNDRRYRETLRELGFSDRDGEIVRQTYAEGRTADDISFDVGCKPTTVGQVNARFRDLCLERPITGLMSASGFPDEQIALALEFFSEHLFALRRDARQVDRTVERWESRLDDRRCLRKLARDRRTSGIPRLKSLAASARFTESDAVGFLTRAFQDLLASPQWDGAGGPGPVGASDAARLSQLRAELVDRLRSDEDWLRYSLPSLGIPIEGVDAYVRLWGNQQFETVFRTLGEGQVENPRGAVLVWLSTLREHDPQLIHQLPHRVRRWYFESRR